MTTLLVGRLEACGISRPWCDVLRDWLKRTHFQVAGGASSVWPRNDAKPRDPLADMVFAFIVSGHPRQGILLHRTFAVAPGQQALRFPYG